MGENAALKTGGSNAFAAAVYYEGSALDIGVGAYIETMGRNAKGLAAVDGGSISAGSGINIVTFGEHSVGIFSNSSATVLTGQTDEERRAELEAIEPSDGVAAIRVGDNHFRRQGGLYRKRA